MGLEVYLLDKGSVPGIGAEVGRRVRNGIARYVSPHGSYRYVLYRNGNSIAALQAVSSDGVNATIANVYVVPTHRRSGIASKLLARARRDFVSVVHAERGNLSAEGRAWSEHDLHGGADIPSPNPYFKPLQQQTSEEELARGLAQEAVNRAVPPHKIPDTVQLLILPERIQTSYSPVFGYNMPTHMLVTAVLIDPSTGDPVYAIGSPDPSIFMLRMGYTRHPGNVWTTRKYMVQTLRYRYQPWLNEMKPGNLSAARERYSKLFHKSYGAHVGEMRIVEVRSGPRKDETVPLWRSEVDATIRYATQEIPCSTPSKVAMWIRKTNDAWGQWQPQAIKMLSPRLRSHFKDIVHKRLDELVLDGVLERKGKCYYQAGAIMKRRTAKPNPKITHAGTMVDLVKQIAKQPGARVLLVGPGASGKTAIARRIAQELPKLTRAECEELNKIYSQTGLGPLCGRPFRAPHYTVSTAGLLGTAKRPSGEVSLATFGVLFLDEVQEFRRKAVEDVNKALRAKIVAPYGWPANPRVVIYSATVPPNASPQEMARWWGRVHAAVGKVDHTIKLDWPMTETVRFGQMMPLENPVTEKPFRVWMEDGKRFRRYPETFDSEKESLAAARAFMRAHKPQGHQARVSIQEGAEELWRWEARFYRPKGHNAYEWKWMSQKKPPKIDWRMESPGKGRIVIRTRAKGARKNPYACPAKPPVRGELTAAKRRRIPKNMFALPERQDLPIHDAKHAKNANSRLTQMLKRGTVTDSEYRKAYRNIMDAYACFGLETRTKPAIPVSGVAKSNPAAYGLLNKDESLGAKLLEYHGGQNTALYAVGSSLYAGNEPPKELYEDAIGELDSLRTHPGMKPHRTYLTKLIGRLRRRAKRAAKSNPNCNAVVCVGRRNPTTSQAPFCPSCKCNPGKKTWAQAKSDILDYLEQEGWKVSDRRLKTPHATDPYDDFTLWFRKQAIWLGKGKTIRGAHTTWLDPRDMTPQQFVMAVTSHKNPAGIPKAVERYYNDVKAGNPGYSDSQAWATAWSIYCKHKRPGSPHCRRPSETYMANPKRRSTKKVKRARKNPTKASVAKVQLKLLEYNEDLVPARQRHVTTKTLGRADSWIRMVSRTMDPNDMWKAEYVVYFTDGNSFGGRYDIYGRMTKNPPIARRIKQSWTYSSGRLRPKPKQYDAMLKAYVGERKMAIFGRMLDNYALK